MNVALPPGKYVLAVSGGVDSMVLLDVLARQAQVSAAGLELAVAHFDHGIRADSAEDCRLVRAAAERYGLPFVFECATLGPRASEAAARDARYAFLRRTQRAHQARAIVTAHHQDDVLETAIFNLLRGTARKGLSSLQSSGDIIRPFLDVPKTSIMTYARARGLLWHEDNTNASDRYARNYIRHHIVPRLGAAGRAQLLALIQTARSRNAEIDALLYEQIARQPAALNRRWFVSLPHAVAVEVLAAWLRANDVGGFSRKRLERLTAAAKTWRPGVHADAGAGTVLVITENVLKLTPPRS